MRPAAQLEASQQQHSGLCKQLQGAGIAIHPILLGMGGTIYTEKKEGKKELRLPFGRVHEGKSLSLTPTDRGHLCFSFSFFSTPATIIRSGDLLLAVALLAFDQGSVT
eukprot:52587-Pelagomonas_calceolata.AAC.3